MAEEKPKKIVIEVNNAATEKLASMMEQERKEKEQKKDEPSLDTLKMNMIETYGRSDLWKQATSKDMLKSMFENWVNDNAEKASPTAKPSGTAPANEAQYGIKPEDLYTRRFLDSQQMVSELRRLSKESPSERERADASHYLDELWKKYVLDKRSQPTRPESCVNPNSPESLLELDLVPRDGFLVPRDKENSEIGQLSKRWREMRKRRMEGQSE